MVLSRNERQVLAGFAICVVVMAVLHEVVQLKELAETVQTQLLEDHYATLKIPPTANAAEITTAFKRATTQLTSKKQEGESQSARINDAYQTLSNPQLRTAYDQQREIVITASGIVSTALVGTPFLVLAYFCVRALARRQASIEVDPKSFAGKVAAALSQIEVSLEMQLQKDASTRLGMQLAASKDGSVLQICGIAGGGLAEEYNCRDAVTSKSESCYFSPAGITWWDLPVFRQSDMITAVNAKLGHVAMMDELKSSGTLDFVVKRQLRGGASVLPWLCQAELRRSCSSSEKWGCEFGPSKDSSDTLEVLQVNDDGAVARWNEAHQELAIRSGDRVVAVDRHFGSEHMLTALRDAAAETSSWLFTRGVLAPSGTIASTPEEVVCGPFDKTSGQKLGIRIGRCLDTPIKGVLLEPQCAGSTVVKEVVSTFLVDQWNQLPGVSKVQEGAVVLAVNGCEDPRQFAAELSKPSVKMRLRPPRVAFKADSKNDAVSVAAGHVAANDKPESAAANFDEEISESLATRLLRSWAPSLAPSFEAKLRECLKQLQSEFTVGLSCLDSGQRVGLQLKKSTGLEVIEVSAGGLVEKYNLELDRQGCSGRPRVMAGDRLVSANGVTVQDLMVQEIAARGSSGSLELVFSRPAAKSAPGVWEAEVERAADEGWGIELQQAQLTAPEGPRSVGVLQVHNIAGGSAIDRWNSKRAEKQQWEIQVGDLLIACEPEVGAARVLDKLQKVHRARLIMLRWHQGPAPEEITSAMPAAQHAKQSLKVTISRNEAEQLGLRLGPSLRDPTRTRVTQVVAGGLVDLHNRSMAGEGSEGSQQVICVGDEIVSVNGEGDPGRFAVCCQQPTIVFHLTRQSGPQSTCSPKASSLTTAPANPSDNRFKMQSAEDVVADRISQTSAPKPEETSSMQVSSSPQALDGSQPPQADDATGPNDTLKQKPSVSNLDAAASSVLADGGPSIAKDVSMHPEVGGDTQPDTKVKSESDLPNQQQERQPQPHSTNLVVRGEASRSEAGYKVPETQPEPERTRVLEKSAFQLNLSAIGTVSAGLNPHSLEHFNQCVQKMQDLSTAMTKMLLAAEAA